MNTVDSNVRTTFMQKSLAAMFTTCAELILLGHVCDRIKVAHQANPKITSISEASRLIWKQEGLQGFYWGIRWNILTHSWKGLLRWHLVSFFEDFYKKHFSNQLLNSGLVGSSVGIVETFLLICPAESIKTKEMTRKSNDFKVVQFVKKYGFRRLYDGWDSILFRQTASWLSFLVAYDINKTMAHRITHKTKLNTFEQFMVGATAGLINVACIMPIDTIKTQLQKQDPIAGKRFIPAVRSFCQVYGFKKLYSGMKIRALRSTWHAGFTLYMMEKMGVFSSKV